MTISRSTLPITADESEGARTDSTPYSHYSLLVSLEELLGLGRIGVARRGGRPMPGPDVYQSNWCTLRPAVGQVGRA